jgi:rhodanese-related sulfurtransferase
MQKGKIAIGAIFVMLLLATFVLVQPAFAKPHNSNPRDISVQQAYAMIKHQSRRNPVLVLDVRNQSEYDLGHLYDSVLIPLYELDDRINELTAQMSMNAKIIVYCQAGSRSAIACEILAEHGFTRVYNMLGGITAWMQADYLIATSYHHVSVDMKGNGNNIRLDIEPLLGIDCDCCGGAQGCASSSETVDVDKIVIEQGEDYTITLITYSTENTIFEVTQNKSLLWSYEESTATDNTTVQFISTELTMNGESIHFYELRYFVQHQNYHLSLHTSLTPLNEDTYNSSLTIVNYAPTGKSDITSVELVEYNSPVTLSKLYASLGKVARSLSKVYQKSVDDTIEQLAERYSIMGQKITRLSDIVKQDLPEYNGIILNNTAGLVDDFWSCLACFVPIAGLCYLGCAGLCVAFPPICAWLWACADLGCNTAVSLYCESIGWCP